MSQLTAAVAIGDTVRLRSGSPLLTVTGINHLGHLTLRWFVKEIPQILFDIDPKALKLISRNKYENKSKQPIT